MRRTLALLLLAALPAGAARAEDAPTTRRPYEWKMAVPRWRHLKLREGWTLYAQKWAKDMTDPYPWLLAATDAMRKRGEAEVVDPARLRRWVTDESLDGFEGAFEAARFFTPGRPVPDAEAADRVLAAARKLAAQTQRWKVEVAWKGRADSLFAEPELTDHPESPPFVLMSLDPDPQVRLLQVTAQVTPKGISLGAWAAVTGPPTIYGTELTGIDPAKEIAELDAKEKESLAWRSGLLRALEPRRTRGAVEQLARPGISMDAVRVALGEPDFDDGSGIHRWVYELDDGSSAVFGEAGEIKYVDLERPGPGNPFIAVGGEPGTTSLYPPR